MEIFKRIYLIIFTFVLFIVGCSEENQRIPITKNSLAPGVVSNILIEPLPGAVKLTYDLPNDQNLAYVKAECMINGILREVKASTYKNNLTIDGFADSTTYIVNLYSVSQSEVSSKPVKIEVTPLKPPFQTVFESISMDRDWGGAYVAFNNPTEANLAISIIYIDSTGYWNSGITNYTKKKSGTFSIRGFDTEETTFGVYLSDRWGNMTDTIVKKLVPMFEKQLDRSNYKAIRLPGDVKDAWGWVLPNLWDGNSGEPGFHTDVDGVWPQYFTIDLGIEGGAKLSRFKIWQRSGSMYAYNDRNIRKFEIWGSANPTSDGIFDESWIHLLTEEIEKPSGLPMGQQTDEDNQNIADGHEFNFPIDIPEDIRYIRIKVTETWAKIHCFYVTEVAFYGTDVEE